MIANTALRSHWLKQPQVLLLAAVCLALFLMAFSQRSTWPRNIGFAESPAASEDEVDAALQQAATAALGQHDGTIIIMDPQTGRIRAVVNPAIAFGQALAPGSTLKPFAALAAMRTSLIDKDSRTLCREHYSHDDFQTVCSHPKDLPPFDPSEAIAYSCNYYFGRLGERLSEDSFRTTLSSFGFGRRTGSRVGEESAGKLSGGKWSPRAALGEGPYLQATPAQLITAYAALINGGRLFVPQIASANDFKSHPTEKIEIDEAQRAVIVNGMRGAVRFGTAERAGLSSLPLYVFGKTGTSTTSKGFRTQGWFVGFAGEGEAPEIPPEGVRLAVLVLVKRSHGADAAAFARPIFEEFARLNSHRDTEAQRNRGTGDAIRANDLHFAVSPRLPVSTSSIRVHLVRENITLELPFEDYVLSVVATEGSVEDEPEALQALAIAARTYALKNRGRHEREGFDFCTTTHCQRFQLDARGRSPTVREGSGAMVAQTSVCDSPRAIAAVRSTAGEVLLDDRGQIADSYFGASCGGATANIGTLWGGNAPAYLRGLHDDYCATAPHHSWTDVIPRSQLLAALHRDARTDVGSRLDDIIVTRRDDTGRAELITLEGEKGKVVRGWDFKIIIGRALGWNKLKSSRFAITRAGNDFVFRGSGFGHGLGLCQEGAHVMAQRGMSYRQILAKYFPGTTVAKGARSDVSLGESERLDSNAEDAKVSAEVAEKYLCVPLRNPLRPLRFDSTFAADHSRGWHADLLLGKQGSPPPAAVSMRSSYTRLNLSSEHFRITYSSLVERREVELVLGILDNARSDLLRRAARASTSVTGLPTINVNINDTTGDFVGRTGQPWWAAAATRGSRIELQPIAVLKRRGVLTVTLRHELAHAFIDAAGHGRTQRWLAEGFALHLAGEGEMISRYERKENLTTGELEGRLSQSVSADEMRALYAAAYREVMRIIQSDGEARVWQRVARQKPAR